MYTDINAWIGHMSDQRDKAADIVCKHTANDILKSSDILFKCARAAVETQKRKQVDDDADAIGDADVENMSEGVAAEFAFWKQVADQGFKVPTDARVHAVASRWQRKIKSDPAFKEEYSGVPDPKKAEFRSKWAQDLYTDISRSREQVTTKAKHTICDKCLGPTHVAPYQSMQSLRCSGTWQE